MFTVPGLGTLAAGRKLGYAQAVTAVTGLTVTAASLVVLTRAWLSLAAPPDPRQALEACAPGLILLVCGLGLFGSAWLWGLASGLSLLRQAKAAESRSAGAATTEPPGT
jgi:hypothetical protein